MLVALVTAVECRDSEGKEIPDGKNCVSKLYQVTVVERDTYRKINDMHVGSKEVELVAALPYAQVLDACRLLLDDIIAAVDDAVFLLTKLNSEINYAR